jgi:BirA family biotin operon repressor/biotin-[acetyl-CoA-carboxylase] ligase
VLGIGLNTNNSLDDAPEELRNSATTLFELTGMQHNPTDVLVGLLSALERLLNQLGSSPETVTARANQLCVQHGHRLTIEQGNRPVSGLCTGIASDGALVLETSAGTQKVYSGTLQDQRLEGPSSVS